MIKLSGMTWNHPRAIDPLIACSREYAKTHDVQVEWAARSLEDFEAFPLDELAAKYDLMVIDHPHVGMACASGCVEALDGQGFDSQLQQLTNQTAGRSQESYFYNGHQWALAIDAATQVACRSNVPVDAPWPTRWADVIAMAKAADVFWPLAPVHAMMSFYTLCANIGKPCAADESGLIDSATATQVLGAMRELSSIISPDCHLMNPIHVLEKMATSARPTYAPHSYGYVSYARSAFRPHRVQFGNIPGLNSDSPQGSTLGGTGMAVSARSANKAAAMDYAFYVASAEIQKTIYTTSGGQPAHLQAWWDDSINHAAGEFFRGTLPTIETSYLRSRFNGYIAFQQSAGEIVSGVLRGKVDGNVAIRQLNDGFRSASRV